MIELSGVTKQFPLAGKMITVLKGISLNIQKGEFVSIMGPSGSGKSTLSSILGCLAAPTSGNYLLMGEDVSKASGDKLARIRNRHIGFIFQDFNLLEGITAVENVMLPLFYVGVNRWKARKRALEKLEQVGLANRANHYPRQLSGGQKQRVAVARALINDPLFLFADEPTGALDSRTGIEIMGLMQKLNSLGHTVVQVTHSLHHCNFGKRILYLVDGQIVRDETVQRPIFALAEIEDKTTSNLVNNVWRLALNGKNSESSQDFESLVTFYQSVKGDSKCLLDAPRAFCHLGTKDALEIVEQLFAAEDWAIRAEVIKYCKDFGEKEAISFYHRGLKDTNEWVRFLAISAFRGMPVDKLSSQLQDSIIECLRDKDERIRATVLVLLAGWRKTSEEEKAIKALEDPDGRVRANAIETLEVLISDKKQFEGLVRKHLEDSNNRARANAIKALLKFDKIAATQAVEAMVNNENNLMKISAAWVLRFFGDEGVRFLMNKLTKEKDEAVLAQVLASLQALLGEGRALRDILNMIDISSLHPS